MDPRSADISLLHSGGKSTRLSEKPASHLCFMVSILQRRSIRRRLRATVLLAMVPLAMLNASPLAAGCICADGHYEPVCHAGQCNARLSAPDCCAHHDCCSGKVCCHHSTTNPHQQ